MINKDALEYIDLLLTPEEIEESNRRVALFKKSLKERNRRKRMNETINIITHIVAVALGSFIGTIIAHKIEKKQKEE